MENNVKNWLADTLIEGQKTEELAKRVYNKQQSKNSLLKCLLELANSVNNVNGFNKPFIKGENVLFEDAEEFIDSLSDYECIKNLKVVLGGDIYHIVLLENDILLLVEVAKYYKLVSFRLMKVLDNTQFATYSDYNNFSLNGLTFSDLVGNERLYSLSFLDLDSHLDLIDKNVKELLVPVSLEEILNRYKSKQERKVILNTLGLKPL